ncbi:class I SAM-dependent methyltransferase [Paenibacillus sp. CECT 9249]|uniref:class I SAM-dependent DNA methyltransferase n=1 Tax=Paenibacillus sp. CECT 9249 TaxID=2845385 RepID=UPI001E2CD401|nr:class I SAM-dependent methyltransferase [Paenibacillus sp. CECT 9249]
MRSYKRFAHVYDRLMEDMPYPEWLRFARTGWEKYGMPKTVVDLGCGTGSITVPLANSGFQVTGIDLSSDMLAIARRKMDQSPYANRMYREGGVLFLQQDIRTWELPGQVDSVVSFCDCFNYLLEEEDIKQAFRHTFQGLKAGGTFMFDVHQPAQFAKYAEEQPFVLNEKSVAYIWTCELDEVRSEIEHHITFFTRAEGASLSEELFERFEEVHVQRAYHPDWLYAQLKAAGFADVQIYGDFKWEPPQDDTSRLFYVAIK